MRQLTRPYGRINSLSCAWPDQPACSHVCAGAGAGCRADASQRTKYPQTADNSDPLRTPRRTAEAAAGSVKARVPMKRLIVKPIPVRSDTP